LSTVNSVGLYRLRWEQAAPVHPATRTALISVNLFCEFLWILWLVNCVIKVQWLVNLC